MPGKIIAITGANGGLGRALAQRFAADGDTVLMLGRTLSKVQEVADEITGSVMAVECDVASPESVRAAFATIAAKYPKIDVLINNAAAFGPYLIEDATDDQILNSVMSNLAGPMFTARSAIPLLNKGGQIINLSSESVEQPFPQLTGYQATKAGLEQFSKSLHRELEPHGIRVTVVRAGAMTGPGATAQMDAEAGLRLFEAAMKRGINLMERPTSAFQSVTSVFRALVDSPADVHVGMIVLEAVHAN